MAQIYNIYCDESCHLENDKQKAMVLGAVWCLKDKSSEINKRIREIKEKHGLGKNFEIKWTKVSESKKEFYLNILDYFFDDDDLHFRGLVIPNKAKLDHKKFSQDHNDWYYKMYFSLLKVLLRPEEFYQIYIDVKDTQGADKIKKLNEVLCNSMYDFDRKVIQHIQTVRSHEVEILQITDLLIGAVGYINRGLSGNKGKEEIVERIKQRTGYKLTHSTLYKEEKFNLFIWEAQEEVV